MNVFGKISVPVVLMLTLLSCGGTGGTGEGTGKAEVPMLFHCIPSDALAVASCEKAQEAVSYYDSLARISRLPLGDFAGCPAVLALCCNTAVDPVLIVDAGRAGADSTEAAASLFAAADSLGLLHGSRTLVCDSDRGRSHSVLFFCGTSNIFNSVERHIDTGVSILDAALFDEAFQMSGNAGSRLFFRHDAAERLIPRNFLSGYIPRTRLIPFVKNLASWLVITTSGKGDADIYECIDGTRLSFCNTVAQLPASASRLAEVLPSDAEFVLDLPIASVESFRKAYESCKDAEVSIDRYRDTIARYSKRYGISPLLWEKQCGISELALVCRQGQKVVLYRSQGGKVSPGVFDNPYRGFLPALYGSAFNLSGSDRIFDGGASCICLGDWTVCGSADAVQSFADASEAAKASKAGAWPVSDANTVLWTPGWYIVCNGGRNKLKFTR